MPLPSEETTPPVTKMKRVLLAGVAAVRHAGLPEESSWRSSGARSTSAEIERNSP